MILGFLWWSAPFNPFRDLLNLTTGDLVLALLSSSMTLQGAASSASSASLYKALNSVKVILSFSPFKAPAAALLISGVESLKFRRLFFFCSQFSMLDESVICLRDQKFSILFFFASSWHSYQRSFTLKQLTAFRKYALTITHAKNGSDAFLHTLINLCQSRIPSVFRR